MKDFPLVGYFLRRLAAQRFLWIFGAIFIFVAGVTVIMIAASSYFTRTLTAEMKSAQMASGVSSLESVISSFGLLLAVILGAYAATALKSADMEPVLTKRLSRETIFATAYASHFMVVLAYWAVFYLIIFGLLLYYRIPLSPEILFGIGMKLLMFAVVFFGISALAMAMPVPAVFLTLVIYALYYVITAAVMKFTTPDQTAKTLYRLPYLLVPDLDKFDMLSQAFTRGGADWAIYPLAAIYGFVWCVVLILGALFIFRRKEIMAS